MISFSKTKRGFTLLELSIVLLILSLIAGGLLTALTQNTRIRKAKELDSKLLTIESALIKFRRQYNRLPCPADGTLLMENSKFGIEASNLGACDGNPAANFNDTANTSGGVLPVRTLGLPDDMMFDPWGGRFSYAVDIRMTVPSSFIDHPINDTTIGSISVIDGASQEMTDKAIAAVVSHGNNGHGAFQLSGARKATASSNAGELMNCNCDSNGLPTSYGHQFVVQPPTGASSTSTNSFDDTVRYWLRSQIYSANDIGMR
jgi:prepilin-type N-terminal cleavage/methylation domain-containing protein